MLTLQGSVCGQDSSIKPVAHPGLAPVSESATVTPFLISLQLMSEPGTSINHPPSGPDSGHLR